MNTELKTLEGFKKCMIDEEDKIIDYNNPNCVNCNDCCGLFTFINEEDFIILKKYLSKNKIGKIKYKRAVDRFLYYYNNTDIVYLKCPFTMGNNKCDIYDKRPTICRDFHCKKELNKLDDKMKHSEHNILNLFAKDFMKNKSFNNKIKDIYNYLKKE